MFDLAATDGSTRVRKAADPYAVSEHPERKTVKMHKLDSPKNTELHRWLLATYTAELDRQYANRVQRATDDDFYDNIQWSADDAQTLTERGQKPIVYNVISASIDWVTGTERRMRTDFKILPRHKKHGKPAERKTQLMKYLSDTSKAPFHVSRAFTDSVKTGLGWLEDAIADDDDEEENLYTRYENWRFMLWDSKSTELDLKDARYVIRTKWIDHDVARAIFKGRNGTLHNSVSMSDSYSSLDEYGDDPMDEAELEESGSFDSNRNRMDGYSRERLRVIEMWFKRPAEIQRIKGGPHNGDIYDKSSISHINSVERGEAKLIKRTAMRMHVALFTTAGMLWLSESPYRHNNYPFTPVWGKRRASDNMPYGMIRGLRDIQEDVNKRASKALWILSTNKIVMEDGAVEDIEELREENARPDAIIVKQPNKELRLDAERELPQHHLELMSRNIAMIQQSSGVTDELLGRKTNATSGVAIRQRQDQGSVATVLYFDNLRFAMQVRGEKQLSNVEQFMDEEKQFRITNMRGSPEFIDINNGEDENDINASKADFIISDADWNATMRQAAVTELLEVMTRFPPEVGMVLLDLLVENMDLPNRDEIVKRIRQITGQKDPDADPDEAPSPEEQAQAQAQAEASQLQKSTLEADLAKKLADADKSIAEAARIRALLSDTFIGTEAKALDAAEKALMMPPAGVHAADHMLAEAEARSQPAPQPTQQPQQAA